MFPVLPQSKPEIDKEPLSVDVLKLEQAKRTFIVENKEAIFDCLVETVKEIKALENSRPWREKLKPWEVSDAS